MNSKGKRFGGPKSNLGLASVFFLCFLFFLAGFFGSTLLSQDLPSVQSRPRILESVEERDDSMPHGETGEPRVVSIPFQVLSWKPRALYFPNFATSEQCKSIIEMSRSKLKPSTLALRKGETAESTKGIRTSSGTFISAQEDKTGSLEVVERKIARATMIPRSHGEAFNILRYEIGQRYVSHYDAFNPAEYGTQKSQRIASFLLYLSDVEEGGETMFPFENDSNMGIGYDYKKCIGLRVKPRRGDGLLFYSLFPNGTIDKTSLHGSCPVIKGEKWVATKWIRDEEQDQ
ncbi:Prolyl 4-hydroxylase [Actinidia chinensis var. chinensis]|uniref:procollagen-proline 4-dioxygenase n=1 Tax=Actinidia chinensis var. chinensis TaxID=1590841 RepID=A0A2R6Q5V2_ACTCC|nr:Prolyl 4-hydroxylase [Actinidia chinensis var. chinensis]